MKNLKFILVALMFSPVFMTLTGCDDDTPPAQQDTTPTEVVIKNSFEIGNERYEVVLNTAGTDAIYDSRTDETTVTVAGTSTKKAGTNIQDATVLLQIKFPGKAKGLFEQERMHPVDMEISIKKGSKPEIAYGKADDSKVKIDVFEYGAVGEIIKGTFSGNLKAGSTGVVKNGLFEVTRAADL